MATFQPTKLDSPTLSDGVYAAKVVEAKERVAESGNSCLAMRLLLPDKQTLSCTITFVPKSRHSDQSFLPECRLIVPEHAGKVELTPEDVIGRYLYVGVVNESDDPASEPTGTPPG
jgi:hypothetical protein